MKLDHIYIIRFYIHLFQLHTNAWRRANTRIIVPTEDGKYFPPPASLSARKEPFQGNSHFVISLTDEQKFSD